MKNAPAKAGSSQNSPVTVDASEFGLTESKAKEISAFFKPMLDQMVALETAFNSIAIQCEGVEPTAEICAQAGALRKRYVKIRTATANVHKEQKDFYLKGGRFIDGWKNAQLMASQGIEEKLAGIEKYFIVKEKARIQKLQDERSAELGAIKPELVTELLGKMDDTVYANYLAGAKATVKAEKEAEEKAERERLEREDSERKERERLEAENEKLRQKNEAQDKQLAEEREAREENERQEREKKEREEREEQERLEADANTSDAQKVQQLIVDLGTINECYSFKSKKNKAMFAAVCGLIDKVIAFIEKR